MSLSLRAMWVAWVLAVNPSSNSLPVVISSIRMIGLRFVFAVREKFLGQVHRPVAGVTAGTADLVFEHVTEKPRQDVDAGHRAQQLTIDAEIELAVEADLAVAGERVGAGADLEVVGLEGTVLDLDCGGG